MERYQNIIIGSGEGGKFIAWHLARSGQKTAVIERRYIGGSCPNINCLPSKNEVWSAKVASMIHQARKYGFDLTVPKIDMVAVRRRKREMVDGLIAVHLEKYQASGAMLIMGEAKFVGSKTLEVRLNDGGMQTIEAERIFLNVGTRPAIPGVPGLAESRPMSNIDLLEIDRLPEHLVVIGGGYVGLEFAQAYRRFGSRVTIIQRDSQLLSGEDADVVAEVNSGLAAEGIEIFLSAKTLSVEGRSGERVTLVVAAQSQTKTMEASDILVAAGRVPNTSGIGLDIAGVTLDAAGYIRVNDRLQTTASNIWAIGECAGSPQFTHVSYDDYRVIADNLAGGSRSTSGRLIPSVLFTDPPVAHVGLSENEARRQGIAYRLAKRPMNATLRTRTIDETRGFAKALIGDDDRILGFTMVGPESGEVMAVVQTAMQAKQPYQALRDSIIAHPTMAEGLNDLFAAVQPKGRVPAA
jgi:pyruvate/2-oxoglutarate dehydrogenase complex dihydrolipoamide dehydrogenase (E3) component